jgi:hypothetical protein
MNRRVRSCGAPVLAYPNNPGPHALCGAVSHPYIVILENNFRLCNHAIDVMPFGQNLRESIQRELLSMAIDHPCVRSIRVTGRIGRAQPTARRSGS